MIAGSRSAGGCEFDLAVDREGSPRVERIEMVGLVAQQPGCIKILRFFCDVILTNLLVGRVAPQKFDIRAHHPK